MPKKNKEKEPTTTYFWQCNFCSHVNFKSEYSCTNCTSPKPMGNHALSIATVQVKVDYIFLVKLRKGDTVVMFDRRVAILTSNKRGMIKDVEVLAEFRGKATGFYNDLGTVYGFNIQFLVLEDEQTLIPVKLTVNQKAQAKKIRKMLSSL